MSHAYFVSVFYAWFDHLWDQIRQVYSY